MGVLLMKIKLDVFLDYLQKFKDADSLYLSARNDLTTLILSGADMSDGKYDALQLQADEAERTRNLHAVVICKLLSTCKVTDSFSDIFEISEDTPADVPTDSPEDSPVDVPEDAPKGSPAADPDSPADASEDIFPAMSAKCRLCPSCVDGRCFFVPDIYDSEFPCQSSAWDDFFKNGGSRSPAP